MKNTGTISDGWEILKVTGTNGQHNTKSLEHRDNIGVWHFKWKITNIDWTEHSVSSRDWNFNVTVTKRGPPEELDPICGSLGSHSDTNIPEKLNSADFIRTQSIQQLWCDLSYANKLVNLLWEIQHHTHVVTHICKTKSKGKQCSTIRTQALGKYELF